MEERTIEINTVNLYESSFHDIDELALCDHHAAIFQERTSLEVHCYEEGDGCENCEICTYGWQPYCED